MEDFKKEFYCDGRSVTFNEQGVIYLEGTIERIIKEYKTSNYNRVISCFCPYSSIIELELGTGLLSSVLKVRFNVDGKKRWFVFAYSKKDKKEIKAAVDYAKQYIIPQPTNAIVYEDCETLVKKETRKRCNVCGHIYCYTLDDIERNRQNQKKALLSGLAGLAGAYSGHYAASAVNTQTANAELNSIVNYDICPKCNSRDVVEICEEEFKELKENSPLAAAPAISNADELKKFKELLDMGIITQEEFDQKKKQLLGL